MISSFAAALTITGRRASGDIALVGCEGVEDDAGPRFHLGDQDLFDAFFDAHVEGVPVHSTGDHPKDHDPIAGQTRDHCLVPPSPERGISLGTLPAQASPVGVGAGLIQKDQPVRLRTHELLATLPVMSCLSHPRACGALRRSGPFLICEPVAAQERIAPTGRALHVMRRQQGGLELGKRDVWTPFNQVQKER